MNITIFVSLLFILQIVYWIVGRIFSKNLKHKSDYFLAGKRVAFFPLMMTFLATQVGGGIVLGAADEASRFGWPVLFYPMGGAFGLILLGLGVGRKLAAFEVSTVAQIFEVVYRSAMLKKIASLFSIISLFMMLVGQIIASNKFLVSTGFNSTSLFIIFWAIVIMYTAQGGLKAVISTDLVQAAFFYIIFLFCFAFVLYSEPSISEIQAPQLVDFNLVSSKLCGWLLMPLLFIVIEQDMGQRCFSGASPKIVSQAALVAGIGAMIIGIVPVFFGTLANTIGHEVAKGASVLMSMIAITTNPWIEAIVGCAVLAAVVSTATSLINAISANVSTDFNLFQWQNSVRMVQCITFLISVAALFFSFYFDNIIDILIQSCEISVSCLFIPISIALFRKRGSFLGAFLSIVFGMIGFFLFRIYPVGFPKEIMSIVLSLIGYCCGEMIFVIWSKRGNT